MKNKFIILIILSVIPLLLIGCESKIYRNYDELKPVIFDDMGKIEPCEVDSYKVYSFAVDLIAYDLHQLGYDVYRGVVTVDNSIIPGLIYTMNEPYDTNEYNDSIDTINNDIYSAGFFQITENGYELEKYLKKEDVEKGVIGEILTEDNSDSPFFVINENVFINSYSCIYKNKYFNYIQIGDFVIEISIKENNIDNYDESMDLYSFDDDRYIFRGDISKVSFDTYKLYTDETLAYKKAVDIYNQVIDFQNSEYNKSYISTIVMFDENVLNNYMLSHQIGTFNDYLVSVLENTKLTENQYLQITSDGPIIQELNQTIDGRMSNGIINTVTSCLAIAGSITFAVVTYGAGAPAAISTIVTIVSGMATIYNMSNLVEGVQDIYYAANEDLWSSSVNPVLSSIKAIVGDDKLATTIYHTWGIASDIATAIMVPVTQALNISKGVGTIKTILNVSRAVIVSIIKGAMITTAGILVGKLVTDITFDLTGNELASNLVGYASTIVVAIVVGNKLEQIDKKYNFSGLYSKQNMVNYNKLSRNEITDDVQNAIEQKFTKNQWNKLSDEAKKSTIDDVAQIISNDLDIYDTPEIIYVNGDINNYGGYDIETNTIQINIKHLNDPDEILNTLAHEMRHAFQNQCAEPGSQMYNSLNNYINPNDDFYAYESQLCEVDAREYASHFVDKFTNIFPLI